MKTPSPRRPRPPLDRSATRALLVASLAALAACGSDDDDDNDADLAGPAGSGDGDGLAFVASRAPDFGSGRTDRLAIGEAVVTVDGSYPATVSDITVATDGEFVYEIAGFGTDTITKYDPDDTSGAIWQFSVNGDEVESNPYDIAFDGAGRGFVPRYGSPTLWIVDPSVDASNEAGFRTGELDLSAYDEDEPNVSAALVVGDRLFVLMERLTGFLPFADKPGYVAVFELAGDGTVTEIDTGRGADGLFGIELRTVNPTALQYVEATDTLYVLGRGNFFESAEVPGDPYTGGLEAIDAQTYESALAIDDGTAEDNRGFFVDALVVSPTKGYLIAQAGFLDNALLAFDPGTGELAEAPVAGLDGLELTSLEEAPDGRVWVGLGGDAPGYAILDPLDDSVDAVRVATELVPIDAAFLPGGTDGED